MEKPVFNRKLTPALKPYQRRLFEIVFEAETPAGRRFDEVLLLLIVTSLLVIMLETVQGFAALVYQIFYGIEILMTLIFTAEYIVRILIVREQRKYIFSVLGIIDLISILPTYLELLFPGMHYLMVFRTLRMLRIFRVLKLTKFTSEAEVLLRGLKSSRYKITVFIASIFVYVVIFGTVLYVVEGPEHGFTSIPLSIYWAVVTMTTVGYGDIVPVTAAGKFISAIVMILGYSIIAVPTGIISVEIARAVREGASELNTRSCPSCTKEGHDPDASYCKFCGNQLTVPE